jgi:hypothetical protein
MATELISNCPRRATIVASRDMVSQYHICHGGDCRIFVLDHFGIFCLPEPNLRSHLTKGVSHHSRPSSLFGRNCLSSNGDLNLDTSVDVDNDLLNNLSGGVEATSHVSETIHEQETLLEEAFADVRTR